MKETFLLVLAFQLFSGLIAAQEPPSSYRVEHYGFSIWVSDENDLIRGEAIITIRFLGPCKEIEFDLRGKSATGKGMMVSAVQADSVDVAFRHTDDKLRVGIAGTAGDIKKFRVTYSGVPSDGLIISKNRYGHRTIFSDNWPNRAHNWIPCIDVPGEKAPVEFIVIAPEHYQVISNGLRIEETWLPGNLKRTHWRETVALPTKVMVIGLADFAVNYAGDVDCIPVHSWVYPEDRDNGFYDYSLALEILPWFIKNIGPYPYRKLANVQSTTRFGGMENASAIFYYERSIKGDRKLESLLTHEIAHQWFGNSATETNWSHIWLSEGFATYMTDLYLEDTYGSDTLLTRLRDDRDSVVAYSRKYSTPVVDTTVTENYLRLLNVNSYQKGGWILHMLRSQLGNVVFMKGIREYYHSYKGKNASTADLRRAMESASGKNLEQFFSQWLYRSGQPDLRVKWTYDGARKMVNIQVSQEQRTSFNFPLDVQVGSGARQVTKRITVNERTTTMKIPCEKAPETIILDPGVQLLFSATVQKGL